MPGYIANIRTKIGQAKFIHPGARILIENEKGEILFVDRADNGMLGLPAGALEENETIEQCIIREVKEETGLSILSLTVIGISSNPNRETVKYPNGDQIQYLTVEFYSNDWSGILLTNDPNEIKQVIFQDKNFLSDLPHNEQSAVESWDYFRKYGRIRLS